MIDNAGERGVSDIQIRPASGVWALTSGVLVKDEHPVSSHGEQKIVDWIRLDPEHDRTNPIGPTGHTSIALDTETYRVPYHSADVPDANALGGPGVVH